MIQWTRALAESGCTVLGWHSSILHALTSHASNWHRVHRFSNPLFMPSHAKLQRIIASADTYSPLPISAPNKLALSCHVARPMPESMLIKTARFILAQRIR